MERGLAPEILRSVWFAEQYVLKRDLIHRERGDGQQYGNLVVPKSALREDSNGKFVLIATSKSTPFGSRYIAQRLPVTVLAEDSYNVAIDTGSSSHEYVITTASGPVESGDQVRIST